jgi:DNA-directed RNA polymerase subunit RPC12/RpoP
MRIIESRDELVIQCKYCNSTLGVEVGDITWPFGKEPHIHCARCKNQMRIKLVDLPQRWLQQIDPH